MNEAKRDALKPEEELVDVLLDFIIVSATLAKKVTQPATPTEPVPTKEDVRAILAEMSSRGFTAQVKELLRQHGAATLSGIDPSEYAALIKDAEGLENG